MKHFKIPEWESSHCLPHCVIATVDYFDGPAKAQTTHDEIASLGISRSKWLWPATAALLLSENNLFVKLYDNDIEYNHYLQDGIDWIRRKYGEIGVGHLRQHFDEERTYKDTEAMLKDKRITVYEKDISEEEIFNFANSEDTVIILNMDHSAFYKLDKAPAGHYFLVNGVKDDKIFLTDPIYIDKVVETTAPEILASQQTLNNEVQHFVVTQIASSPKDHVSTV